MSLHANVYEVTLSNINDGYKLIFDIATDNIDRYVRKWNDESMNIHKVVKVKHIRSYVRLCDFGVQDKLEEAKALVNHG